MTLRFAPLSIIMPSGSGFPIVTKSGSIWQNTKDESGVVEFPSKFQIVLQWLEAIAMEIAQNVAKELLAADTGALLWTTIVCKDHSHHIGETCVR